jgi:hypothetical protein
LGSGLIDGLIYSAISIAAHFFEDALVYNPAYAFLWPITMQKFGIGIMQETRNMFGFASNTVVLIGIILLVGAVVVRTFIERKGWVSVFLKVGEWPTECFYRLIFKKG